MRWIFLTLLLLNALVLAAQWLSPSERVDPGADARLVEGVPQLVLLRERPAAEQASAAEPAPSEGSPARQAEPPGALASIEERARETADFCLKAGPAASETQAQSVLVTLRQQGIESWLHTEEIRQPSDYWVYLPPLKNRRTAIAKLRELQQERGIDSFLISQGALANGISLGLLKTREAATRLQKERIAQGLDARLAEVEHVSRQYWIVAKPLAAPGSSSEINQMLASSGIRNDPQQIACKSVATAGKLP